MEETAKTKASPEEHYQERVLCVLRGGAQWKMNLEGKMDLAMLGFEYSAMFVWVCDTLMPF